MKKEENKKISMMIMKNRYFLEKLEDLMIGNSKINVKIIIIKEIIQKKMNNKCINQGRI